MHGRGPVHTYPDIFNPQLFLSRFGFRPHVSGESGIRIPPTFWIRFPEWKVLNKRLWIRNREDANKIRIFFLSSDVSRLSPALIVIFKMVDFNFKSFYVSAVQPSYDCCKRPIMPNGGLRFQGFFPCPTDELDDGNKLNKRTSTWWGSFVSKTVIEEAWRENFRIRRRSLFKLTDELRVNPDTCGLVNDPCYSYRWKRGWSWPCFDTTIRALSCKSCCSYAN